MHHLNDFKIKIKYVQIATLIVLFCHFIRYQLTVRRKKKYYITENGLNTD